MRAKEFADVLRNIIESKAHGGTEQWKVKKEHPQRFFEGVIIATDDPGTADSQNQGTAQVEGTGVDNRHRQVTMAEII